MDAVSIVTWNRRESKDVFKRAAHKKTDVKTTCPGGKYRIHIRNAAWIPAPDLPPVCTGGRDPTGILPYPVFM